jgi:hypothetical protein
VESRFGFPPHLWLSTTSRTWVQPLTTTTATLPLCLHVLHIVPHILRVAVHAHPTDHRPSRRLATLQSTTPARQLSDKLPTTLASRARGMLDTGQTHIHHAEYKEDAS